jgi:hypothetical protein
MSYTSRVVYTATAGQTQFDYTFPYLDKAHIHVLVDGAEVSYTWVNSSRIALNTPASAGKKVSVRRITPVNAPLADFQNGSVLTGPDLQLAVTQSLYRDQEISDDVLDIADPGGTIIGGAGGVTSVNGRSGSVSLTASDVLSGFGTQVGASLSAGLGISLSTTGGITTITNTGGGTGGGTAGVTTVNGRSGAVSLTASDVTSGFGAAVAGSIAAGSGIGLTTSGGVTTISYTGSSPVTSVAGRTGAITLSSSDITNFGAAVGSALAAGTGISISTSAGVTTITSTVTGGGGGGGASSSTFVGAGTLVGNNTASIASSLPAGSAAGDLAVLLAMCSSLGTVPTPPASWTVIHANTDGAGGQYVVLAYKVLDSADVLAGTVTVSYATGGGVQQAVVWRGPTKVSVGQEQVAGSGTTHTLTGFPKDSHNIGTVGLYYKFGSVLSTPPGAPFTTRSNAYSSASNTSVAISDAIGGSLYVDNSSITWSDGSSVSGQAWALELRNDGVVSGGSSGVSSVNGRTGAVSLSASDVSSGFGSAVSGVLTAGAGISLSTTGGVTTITNTGGGGGGGVSSVNGRTGAVSLTVSDVSSGFGTAVAGALAAGAGVTLTTSGGVTTIAAGSGSLAYSYTPAWENGVATGNTAGTNTTNLQNLINTLSTAGGGTIWFNAPGPYQINGTITLKSNVSIRMTSGAYFSWQGSSAGTIFKTDNTTVLYGCHLDLFVNEGSSFSGIVFDFHSAYFNTFNLIGLGTQVSTGTFIRIRADSSGVGPFSDANHGLNKYRAHHRGTCGYFLLTSGTSVGVNGNPQVVTLNNFEDLQGTNVLFRGIKLEDWSDSNEFSGQTRMNMTGANAIGVMINEANSGTPSVYNTHFTNLAVDTFGSGLSRIGVVLNNSKGITCDEFHQLPVAEGGDFIGTSCLSYQLRKMKSDNSIYIHQKNVSSGL